MAQSKSVLREYPTTSVRKSAATAERKRFRIKLGRPTRGPLFHQLVPKLGSWLACELLNDLIIRHNSFPLRKAALLTSLPSRIDDEFWQDRLDVSLSHFATYGSASHGRINIGAATKRAPKTYDPLPISILNLLSQAKTLLEE